MHEITGKNTALELQIKLNLYMSKANRNKQHAVMVLNAANLLKTVISLAVVAMVTYFT